MSKQVNLRGVKKLKIIDSCQNLKIYFTYIFIGYYIRDQERKNVTVRGRTTFDVEMNVFHDIPLNLMVWNEDIVNTRIFYVVRMGG